MSLNFFFVTCFFYFTLTLISNRVKNYDYKTDIQLYDIQS